MFWKESDLQTLVDSWRKQAEELSDAKQRLEKLIKNKEEEMKVLEANNTRLQDQLSRFQILHLALSSSSDLEATMVRVKAFEEYVLRGKV